MAQSNGAGGAGRRRPKRVRLPVVGIQVPVPEPESLAWYAGLGLMAALEVIDWELALVVGLGHLIAENARSRTLAELAEGVESGG